MKRSLNPLFKLFLVAWSCSIAFAAVAQPNKPVPLSAAIEAVTKAYGTKFLYEKNLVEGKTTTVNLSNMKGKQVEDVLKSILYPNDLVFLYIKDNYYTIVPKSRINPDLLEINSPQETKRAEPQSQNVNPETVSGVILDEKGLPLPGVTIHIKGSTRATRTNDAGKYTIEAEKGAIIEFTFIGFKKKEVTVGASKTINVVMVEEVAALDQVVVVGYGTTKRKDLTGSIATIDTKELKDVPHVTLDNALAGKAAGVQVTKVDGAPGSAVRIRVRGGTSLMGGNDPLYVIDGIPVTVRNDFIGGGPEVVNPVENNVGGANMNSGISGAFLRGLNSMAGLNLEDVESIDVLKDASATAIYGSKAANGVVIITTKKGTREMKPQLDLHYYGAYSQARQPELLNADEYKMLLKESAQNLINIKNAAGQPLPPSNKAYQIVNDPAFFGNSNTNWMDQVLQNTFSQNLDLSLKGGGNSSRYYTSLSYMNSPGVVINTGFKRVAGKISLDCDVSNRFRIMSNLDYGFTHNDITNGVYSQAYRARPDWAPYDENGAYTNFGAVGATYEGMQNPVALSKATNRSKDILLLGSLSAEYDILPSLKFKSTASLNMNIYRQQQYIPSFVDVAGYFGNEASLGRRSEGSRENQTWYFENTLTWIKEFNNAHRLNLLAGTSWEQNNSEFFMVDAKGFPDDYALNNLSSAVIPVATAGSDPASRSSLLSFYLRANYSYRDKYLLTFTGRADGSSKFGPENQFGFFPSGAVAWRVSEENFLKNVTWIDEIKLRASTGLTGTQNIGDHMWRTLYTPTNYAGAPAVIPTQLGDAGIHWESTLQSDLGLEYSFFKGRLGGGVSLYTKTTDGLLLNVGTAPSSSYTGYTTNFATIRNKGLEFEIKGGIIKSKNFSWTSAFNISRNVSKLTDVNVDLFENPAQPEDPNFGVYIMGNSVVKKGEPLGLLYGYKTKGILRSQADVEAYKAKLSPLYLQYFFQGVGVGDIQYELTENGAPKRDVIGSAAPKFFGGFNNTFSYKNLSLSTLFTFSYGNQLIYGDDNNDMKFDNAANRGKRMLGRYTPENPNADRPRLIYQRFTPVSDMNVFDASYIKLKSVTLSYNLPAGLLLKIGLKNASVYASGYNLFTITSYPGNDPETTNDPYSTIGGYVDVSNYAPVKTYTLGVRVGF